MKRRILFSFLLSAFSFSPISCRHRPPPDASLFPEAARERERAELEYHAARLASQLLNR